MQISGRVPVKFDRPPVTEVACGVAFVLPKPIKTAHIGLYWSTVADEFPRCDDAQPIALIVEGPGSPDSADYNVQIEQVSLPPLRRVWLINEPGTHLLQLQDDRFLFNWKRTADDVAYPSYAQVVAGFRAQWAKYMQFLVSQGLGEPSITQLEMTYFNFVPGAGHILRDYTRDESGPDRFLPPADVLTLRSLYSLPEGAGRLHVLAGNARNAVTGEKGVRLELTARGLPRDTSSAACEAWFDLAHDWITHGFADVTTSEAHRIWGRTA